MSHFSNKLKQLRLEHGLTQSALAKELNVTQNAIFNWENGKREPNLDTITEIANYFHTTLAYLLDGKENAKNIPQIFVYDKNNNLQKVQGVPKFTVPSTSYAPVEAYEILHSLIDQEGITDVEREKISVQLNKLLGDFSHLNNSGRKKAVERVEELTEILRYIQKGK